MLFRFVMAHCLPLPATTTKWILFHVLINPSFCLEETGSAKCTALKLDGSLKPLKIIDLYWNTQMNVAVLWTSKVRSLSLVVYFPHIRWTHSWLSIPFQEHLRICMSKSQSWLPDQELMSTSISWNICQEDPNLFGTSHLISLFLWPPFLGYALL